MTDRPIIFSGPMVRALLDGRKTMTRRILKPQPQFLSGQGKRIYADADYRKSWREDGNDDIRYSAGDRLYVRECIWQTSRYPFTMPSGEASPQEYNWGSRVQYAADGDPENTPNRHYPNGLKGGLISAPDPDAIWLKRPSIHMPRHRSRLTLIVTSVKIERVQSISNEDAIAEGVETYRAGWSQKEAAIAFLRGTEAAAETKHGSVAQRLFYLLWTSINGEESWSKNPYVVAISFSVEKQNIDTLPKAIAA